MLCMKLYPGTNSFVWITLDEYFNITTHFKSGKFITEKNTKKMVLSASFDIVKDQFQYSDKDPNDAYFPTIVLLGWYIDLIYRINRPW